MLARIERLDVKARKIAVEKLTELGALEKEEPYTTTWATMNAPMCRSSTPERAVVFENILAWKDPAVRCRRHNKFHPDRWQRFTTIGCGIQDWCISRQLWWGHRSPSGMPWQSK